MKSSNRRLGGLAVWVAVIAAAGMGAPGAMAQSTPTLEEMWKIIQDQAAEIRSLRVELERTGKDVAETGERLEATAEQIEQTGQGGGGTWADRTTIGGYGELHYNNLEDDATGTDLERIDFHRFVLYFGHEFNDSLRFFSELEVEHALVVDTDDGSGPGEVELEQAFLEFDLGERKRHRLRAGLDLIPVGIINSTHEPTTFFGVERNRVEAEIIPTTWWEPGLALLGEIATGWDYHLAVHDGLAVPTTGGSAFRIRSGRQKGAQANAESGAATGRIRYSGIPGVEVALTAQYQEDITQGALDIGALLLAGHVDLRRGPWGLRALAARWDLDEGGAGTGPATGPSPGRDEQFGWYVEPSYRFAAVGPLPGEMGVFGRFSEFNRNAGDSSLDGDDQAQVDVGLNYWPHPDVVFKFDYQHQMDDATFDGFNLGVGYQF